MDFTAVAFWPFLFFVSLFLFVAFWNGFKIDRGQFRFQKILHLFFVLFLVEFHGSVFVLIYWLIRDFDTVCERIKESARLFSPELYFSFWLVTLGIFAYAVIAGFASAKRNDVWRKRIVSLIPILWVLDILNHTNSSIAPEDNALFRWLLFINMFFFFTAIYAPMLLFYTRKSTQKNLFRTDIEMENSAMTVETPAGNTVNAMWRICWGCDSTKKVNAIDELEQSIDELHSAYQQKDPELIVVESMISGDCITIGVGSDLSVLNYVKSDKEPPYLSSVGTKPEAGIMSFGYGGTVTEIPLHNCIPYESARKAVISFAKNGLLPDLIQWEED